MRFSSAFVAAAALYLAPFSVAADEPEVPDVERPNFTRSNLKAPFLEQFTDDWETRWKASHAKKVNDNKESEEEWAYVGTWAVEEPTVIKGINGDKGLVLKDQAAHHAISAIFPEKIDNAGKTLVVQYEVKAQEELSCAGAYMKLLQENKALHQDEFSNASPYIIMFGPDKCGSTNKVHFIIRHKNPISGEYEEKHMIDTPYMTIDTLSHLYTLIIKPDETFEIRMDGKSEKNGTFAEDFSPEFTPPKEINDPDDKKPSDWVDEAKIKDPDAVKPDDWDEDAPAEIVDEEAVMPDDWLEDEPEMIRDPDVVKPDDWNDEEDGDWEAPLVPNPKCQEASGCGPWKKPMKKNPAYKGKWTVPMIDNPAYQGVWKPKKIANPNHFEAKEISNLEPMGAIGFELWSMNSDILFDNIYIGHSIEDAEKLREETFDVKNKIEKTVEELAKPKDEAPDKAATDVTFKEDPVNYVKQKLDLFITMAKRDPVEAVKFLPEVAGGIGVVVVTALALLLGGLGAGAKSPQVQDAAAKAKAKAGEAKDKAVDTAQAAKEKAAAEANKRTTRSAAAE